MPSSSDAEDTEATVEQNKKWKAYLLINITSMINFVSISEAQAGEGLSHYYEGGTDSNAMLTFGIVSFAVTLIVLLFHITPVIREKVGFQNLMNGKVEGWMLLLLVLWWCTGVTVITRAGALGYAALNIYFSSWANLFASINALNKWGRERNVLTLHKLTRISKTLPYWWMMFWSSLVMMGSAADTIRLATTDNVRNSCHYAVGVGIISILFSAFFILSHYEFLDCCEACKGRWLSYGRWFELTCSIFMNFWLVSGLDELTGAGEIASTITGNGGSDPSSEDYVPGSNIYMATWVAFIASMGVTVKWKEARAIKFAQTTREENEDVEELDVADVEKGDVEEGAVREERSDSDANG